MLKWIFRLGLGYLVSRLASEYMNAPQRPEDKGKPSPRRPARKSR